MPRDLLDRRVAAAPRDDRSIRTQRALEQGATVAMDTDPNKPVAKIAPTNPPEHLLVAHRTTRRLSNCREASAS